MDKYVIEITDLTKKYNENQVLENLNLKVKEKEITVIMGANGQGKTTLLFSLLSLIPINSGEIVICGEKINQGLSTKQKNNICFISDDPPFLEYLSGADNLKYIAHIYKKKINKEQITNILKQYDLDYEDKTLVKDYSKGMRTKLALCFIDIIDSKIVILDEPTVGLDIVTVNYLENRIKQLKKNGKTILITSHDVSFVSSIADEIFLLNNKKVKILLSKDQEEIIRNAHDMSEVLLEKINA